MKRAAVLLSIILLSGTLDAQDAGIRGSLFGSSSNSATRLQVPVAPKASAKQDYVLYRDLVRKHSWLEGLGEPITQEVADHLPYYYKLSLKNKAGHYTFVQAMHGRHLTADHPLSPYIFDKKNDLSESNAVWRQKLLTVGQWMMFSDASGEVLMEERAYEARDIDADMVYSMQVHHNDAGHVTIAYLDSWGLPADMRKDSLYTYGSLVYITYDGRGRDAAIDYLDGEGFFKPNNNGVDRQAFVYDERDRVTVLASQNAVGDDVYDNWGNAGNLYIYHSDGSYSIVRVDKYRQPMRMPAVRASAARTFIRCDVIPDEWGRTAEEIMYTAEGVPDETSGGIHRIVYAYSEDGVLQSVHYYSLEGKEVTL